MNWLVATVRPNCETLVQRGLRRQGIGSYSPRFRAASGRVLALFPGYLFVPFLEVVRPLLGTRGVTGLVSNAGAPCTLRDDDVRAISEREDDEGLVVLPRHLAPFGEGSAVRVARGPLFGAEGVCDGMCGRDRVYVLLRMLGREVRSKFRKADLVLA